MSTPHQRRRLVWRMDGTSSDGLLRRSRRQHFGVSSRCLLLSACLQVRYLTHGPRGEGSCLGGSSGVAEAAVAAALKTDLEAHSSFFSKVGLSLRGGGGGTNSESYSTSGGWTASSASNAPTWGSKRRGILGLDQHIGDIGEGFLGLYPGANTNWDDDEEIDEIGLDEVDPLVWASHRSRQGDADIDPDDDEGRRERIRKRVRRIRANSFLPTSAVSTTTEDVGAKGNARLVPPSSRYMTTGTTIAGIVVEVDDDEADGGGINGTANHNPSVRSDSDQPDLIHRTKRTRSVVILGADTRATAGRIVADKNASKIHQLASNLFACGAGTSADLMHLTRQAEFTFRLTNSFARDVGNDNITLLSSSSSPSEDTLNDDTNAAMSVNVHAACRWLQSALYEQGGSCQANLIVGGVQVPNGNADAARNGGPRESMAVLRAIHPHGSTDDVQFAALGSGGLAAMAVLESRYRPYCPTLQEAIRLVTDAIRAGISNDLGSGSSIDLCILDSSTGRATHIRSAVPEEVLSSQPVAIKDDTARDGSQDELGSIPGVNGFGNVPFTVRSSRIIQRYYHDDVDDGVESAWNEILGLR